MQNARYEKVKSSHYKKAVIDFPKQIAQEKCNPDVKNQHGH